MRRRVVIHWGISSFFGWGVYGLNLALNWSRDPSIEPLCSFPIPPSQIAVDPVRQLALSNFLRVSGEFVESLRAHAGKQIKTDVPILSALGNDFKTTGGAFNVGLTGSPTLGVVFFELPQLDEATLERARAFPLIVAGSTWNEQILRAYGLTNVTTVIQGIDQTLFHPAQRQGVLPDRFTVFTGGKLELRKGQDLVVTAFSRFAKRHPDALLVAAWHSPWPQLARSVDNSGVAAPMTFTDEGKTDFPAWAAANDIAPHQFLDLGAVPNALMPPVLREMDIALFPNRSEGGTNLVAMECMACGVPTILSANTGHLDLIDGNNCYALEHQADVAGAGAGVGDVKGWGNSSVDEIVDCLERAYRDRNDARRRGDRGAGKLAGFTWSRTADAMKKILSNY
ncbi:glycosyltransferase family 4 protein [Oryzibacter oryziterrae]|uniref:glycosyltransferase family 4 protein n=1 Tax=Oryzibacter oryziterrae TaxID=2766474 RepID=UPI001F249B91|nr:glycosyltransferase family 4 protein [Oryzibacter oryziterrae]